MEKELELQNIKGFIRRRKKVFVLSFSIIFITGVIVALILTPIYTSVAMIRIEDQQIPENYVESTLTDYANERIRKISYEILSRPKLLEIIDKYDLYQDIKNKKTQTQLLKKMRKDIELKTIEATTQNKRDSKIVTATVAFTLAYDGKDPVKVQKVADTLSNLYLEEDIKTREKFISGTSDFLKAELDRLNTEISSQENNISDFKQKHLRELPADRGYNLQAIARLEQSLDKMELRQQLLQERRVILQSKIANVEPLSPIVIGGKDLAIHPAKRLKQLRLQLASMQSVYSEKHPSIRKKKNEIAKLEQKVKESEDSVEKIKRLQQLEIKLASAKAKLGSKHPDVKAMTREIAILRKLVDDLATADAKVKISEEKPDNPIYINLKTQIDTTEMEIAALAEEMPELIFKIDEYQMRIENAPIVEKELNALTRDYVNLKRKYSEISNKLLNAEMIREMEGKEKGKRFNITSPAYLPQEPTKPNRLMIIVISFVLAIGLGAVLAAFCEYTDDSIKTPNQLKELTNIPVLSEFSYFETREEKWQRRKKNMIWVAIAILCFGISLLIVDQFFMDMDQVWEVVVERIMLLA